MTEQEDTKRVLTNEHKCETHVRARNRELLVEDLEDGKTFIVAQKSWIDFAAKVLIFVIGVWAIPITKITYDNNAMLSVGPRFTADQGHAMEIRLTRMEEMFVSHLAAFAALKVPPEWLKEKVTSVENKVDSVDDKVDHNRLLIIELKSEILRSRQESEDRVR